MLNPNNFFKPSTPIGFVSSSKIALDKLADPHKTRWDEPLMIPPVLYYKFKLELPKHLEQSNQYPSTLIDYIKRAYNKCKDEPQRKNMETELKNVIAKYQNQFNQVHWEQEPIPFVTSSKRVQSSAASTSMMINQKNQFKKQGPSVSKYQKCEEENNSIIEQTSSKAKWKVSKALQKWQQKFKKQKGEQKEMLEEKKMFIGFKNEPPPKHSPPKPLPSSKSNINSKSNVQSKLIQKTIKDEDNKNKNRNNTPITKETPIRKIGQQTKGNNKQKIKNNKKQLQSKLNDTQNEVEQMVRRYAHFNKSVEQHQQIHSHQAQVYQIVGKNTSIEKPYLRITGVPDPQLVRPSSVLKKALEHFLREYKQGSANYSYISGQFKSIRQDLTVQHIQNDFTVQVYEQNMKISLFENDSIEYKLCLSNLWQLYRQGLYYTSTSRDQFISYQLLTLIMQEKFKELEYRLTLLLPETLQTADIQQTLKLKRNFMLGNYTYFFDFYSHRDEVCRCMLNQYIDRTRIKCLLMFCRTCGEKMRLSLLGEIIGQDQDVLEALIQSQGGIIKDQHLMLKDSYSILAQSQYLQVKKVTSLLN